MWFWHRCPLIHHPPAWYDVVIQEQKSAHERYALVMPLTAEPNIERKEDQTSTTHGQKAMGS